MSNDPYVSKDYDSFSLAQERFDKTEDRTIRDAGFGSTKDALTIIQKHISNATLKVQEKLGDTSRSSFKSINTAISMLRPELIALVALQGGLDCIGGQEDLNRTFHILGGLLDRELYAESLRGFDRKLSGNLEDRARRKGSSVKHRRAAVAAMARKQEFEYKRWGHKTKALAGMWLVEVLTELDDVFVIMRGDAEYDIPNPYLTLTQEALEYSQDMVKLLLDAYPVALPLLVSPPRWTSHKLTLESNGRTYETPLIRKGGRSNPFIKQAIANRTMDQVLDAMSNAGSVNWRINERILECVRLAYDLGLELEGMPVKDDLALPPKVGDDIWNAMSPEEQRVRRMEIGEKLGKNRSLIGERSIYEQDMSTADYLLTHGNSFWTPVNLDYRGRVYGVPYFNFQRQDYVRGLFEFADGMALGTMGFYWLRVHLANCGDFEKVSKATFADRVTWVADNHQRLVEMALSPMDDLWWTEADAPFQFLAAAMDYAGAYGNPGAYVSHVPVSFDGTCSGLQHLAAMTRCDSTAPLVNLTNCDLPQDVYRTVADGLNVKLKAVEADDEFYDVATLALAYGVDRSLVKRNVMTYTYGSKKFGMIQQLLEDTMRPLQVKVIRKTLDAHPFQCANDTFLTAEGLSIAIPGKKAARLLGAMTFDTIEETVKRPAEAMRFLQQLSKAYSHEGKPTVWHTPLGFPVVLHYPNQKTDLVRLWMHDRGVRIKARMATNEDIGGINKAKTANAIAPCFVHSYDACHLMMVVNHANNNGIANVALVHDSFGCHAAVAGRFRSMITDTFHQLYSENDVLSDILQEAFAQIQTNSHRLPTRMSVTTGSYNIDDIKDASYAFA